MFRKDQNKEKGGQERPFKKEERNSFYKLLRILNFKTEVICEISICTARVMEVESCER